MRHHRLHFLVWCLLVGLGAGGLVAPMAGVNAAVCATPGTSTNCDASAPGAVFNDDIGGYVSPLAAQLPFAYYPSVNKLEVAIQRADWAGRSVTVGVLPVAGGRAAASGQVALDRRGRAQALIDLPDLPDGVYAVEYSANGKSIRSPKTFRRIHYPWEGNSLGTEHTVYPPFKPVAVAGQTVTVVDRSYRMNAFGLMDSVVSKGHELLAAPIQLRGMVGGNPIQWRVGEISANAPFPDLAVVNGSVTATALHVTARTEIEEDGMAKVTLTLAPGPDEQTIDRLWIEIPVKDQAAPLFHFVGFDSMRLNYGGITPRGGNIRWAPGAGWTPPTWRASSPAGDGVVWDASQVYHHTDATRWIRFAPYVWLGAEERGLAWFGDSDKGYVVDRNQPAQVLVREGDRLVLRVYLIQAPAKLTAPRTVVFGLQASPTKPLPADWRTRSIAAGVGPVVNWGGWQCASKYPDGEDWRIVDQIQAARRTGRLDEGWFRKRAAHRTPGRLMFNDPKQPDDAWVNMVLWFGQNAANSNNAPGGTYFEEHAHDPWIPALEVFQDEWSATEFIRFQKRKPIGPGALPFDLNDSSVAAPSYHDFALHYANEWMKRGVSLYFDNAFPHYSQQLRWTAAYPTAEGKIHPSVHIFPQRAYYRRIWKLMQNWNRNGAPYPIDVTHHMTNTQVLPHDTWTSATLDLEQRYHVDSDGRAVPWPPDYTRTVSMSRQVGSVPFILDPLYNQWRNVFYDDAHTEYTARMMLSNWGMFRVHEVGGDWPTPAKVQAIAGKYYQKAWEQFGYGDPEVTVHNYWDVQPYAQVDQADVKWIVLQRAKAPQCLALLQSYRGGAVTARLALPGAVRYTDVEQNTRLTADHSGGIAVELGAPAGTRMFWVDGCQPLSSRSH